MSVVRGRPPGLAGGMNGSSSRYWSSLSAWPDPKSPTSTRSSSVHIEASQPESPPERRHHNRPALVKPTSTPFQNRLLVRYRTTRGFVYGTAQEADGRSNRITSVGESPARCLPAGGVICYVRLRRSTGESISRRS